MPEFVSNEVFVTLSEKWKVYSDFKEDMVANLGDEEIDAVMQPSLSEKLLR